MITYCNTCLNPSTRPNIYFDKKGRCRVCVFEEKRNKKKINWKQRNQEIQKIKKWGQKESKSHHDCIVTVSGGKDSMRQAFYARDTLGMNPLLVSTVYPPQQVTDRGIHNLSNLISHDFDCITLSLDPIKWKELIRHGFLKFGNIVKSAEMALYAVPIHVAISYKIPLLFYGENPALTIGEKHGRLDGNAIGIKEGNTIKGGPKSLNYTIATKQDFHFYEYPSYQDIKRAKLRIVYLGYYIKDWYGYKNASLAIAKGLKIREDEPKNTGDIWNYGALDDDFKIVNQYLKYLKYGFGCVNDQACEAIHLKIMSRKEAIKNILKYDGACHLKYIKKFCKYINISLTKFWLTVDKFVNKDLFEKKNGSWKPKFKVY